MQILLALALSLASTLAFAQETPKEEQPLVSMKPKVLLKSVEQKNHYFFIGVHESNHFVFEVLNGEVKRHLLAPQSTTYFDGGSMDFYTPEGLRIIVPTLQQGENYLKMQTEPMVVYPDRPRETFERVQPQISKLEQLGLLQYIDRTPKKPRQRRQPRVKAFEPEKFQTFLIIKKSDDDKDRSVRQKIRALENADSGTVYAVDDFFGKKEGGIVWAHPNRIAELYENFKDADITPVEIKPTLLTLANFKDATFVEQLSILRQTASSPVSEIVLTPELIWYFEQTLETLGRAHHLVQNIGVYGGRSDFKTLEEYRALAQNHPFYAHGEILRAAARDMMEILYKSNQPLGFKALIKFAGQIENIGLSTLTRRFGQHANGLEYFLDWNRDLLKATAKIPALISYKEKQDLGYQRSKNSGGIYDSIYIIGENVEWKKFNDLEAQLFERDRWIMAPFYLLSLEPEARRAKSALIQFIIDSDHMISEVRGRDQLSSVFNDFLQIAPFLNPEKKETTEFARQIWQFGNLSTESFAKLRALVPGHAMAELSNDELVEEWKNAKAEAIRQNAQYAENVNNYTIQHTLFKALGGYADKLDSKQAREIYFANAADIFIELLETAPQTLRNSGTFVSILDEGTGLMRKIEARIKQGQVSGEILEKKMLRYYMAFSRHSANAMVEFDRDRDKRFSANACRILLNPKGSR